MVKIILRCVFCACILLMLPSCLVDEILTDRYESSEAERRLFLIGFLEPGRGFDIEVRSTIHIGDTVDRRTDLVRDANCVVRDSTGAIIETLRRRGENRYVSQSPELYMPGEAYTLEASTPRHPTAIAREIIIPAHTDSIVLDLQFTRADVDHETRHRFDLHCYRSRVSDQDFYYITDLLPYVDSDYCDFIPHFHPVEKPEACQVFTDYYTKMFLFSSACEDEEDFVENLSASFPDCSTHNEPFPNRIVMQYGAVQRKFYDYLTHFHNAASSSDYLPREPGLSRTWVEGGYGVVAGRTSYTARIY